MNEQALEKLLQAFGRGFETVEFAEVGVTLTVRSLSALELVVYHQKRRELPAADIVAWLLERCAGLSEEKLDKLGPLGAPALFRLLEVANRLNGLVSAAAEETRGE